VGSLAAGAALLAVFLWIESRAASPMVSLELFKSPSFLGANILTLLLYAAIGVYPIGIFFSESTLDAGIIPALIRFA
jgi:hypothetical protein